MRVYVTGASGFVGRKLLPRLESAGLSAIGVDTEVDVTNPSHIEASLRVHRPDAIIHLAAMSSVALSLREPEKCHRLNFGGTQNVLTAAEAACPDARILLVGSTDQYAPTTSGDLPIIESTPLAPRSPYARSKAAAELLGQEAARAGRDVIRIRASNHTGRGQSDQFVISSFARQVAAIRSGHQEPRLRVGNLDSARDFLHVDDVVDAYVTLLDRRIPADVYNVASGTATPIREILDQLIEIAQIDPPTIDVDPERFRPTDWCVADASKLRRVSNWEPRVSLDALLRDVYAGWSSLHP